MKSKVTKKILCAVLCACVLTAAGCKRSEAYEQNRIGLAFRAAQINQQVVKTEGESAFLGFAADMFVNSQGENALTAPFSIYNALGMAISGASGETLKQAEIALGQPIDDVNEFCLAINQDLKSKKGRTKVSVANSVWIKESYKEFVKQGYLEKISGYYAPEIFALEFDKNAVKRINNWVFNNTDGEIDEIIKGFNERSRMQLVNATFIEGKWMDEVKNTYRDDFTNLSGGVVAAQYFKGKSALYHSDTAYAVRRYLQDGYYFMAIMPKGDFVEYCESFSGEELACLLTEIDERGATYEMPTFDVEYSSSLVSDLKNMGMVDAFNEFTADFTNMTDCELGLYISEAEQKTTIKVDKNGLKATATIRLDLGAKSSAPPKLEPLHIPFNKPFIYLVCTGQNVPLFLGRMEEMK